MEIADRAGDRRCIGHHVIGEPALNLVTDRTMGLVGIEYCGCAMLCSCMHQRRFRLRSGLSTGCGAAAWLPVPLIVDVEKKLPPPSAGPGVTDTTLGSEMGFIVRIRRFHHRESVQTAPSAIHTAAPPRPSSTGWKISTRTVKVSCLGQIGARPPKQHRRVTVVTTGVPFSAPDWSRHSHARRFLDRQRIHVARNTTRRLPPPCPLISPTTPVRRCPRVPRPPHKRAAAPPRCRGSAPLRIPVRGWA